MIRSADALARELATLALPGAWGILEADDVPFQGCVRRVPGGYVLEVASEPGAEARSARMPARGPTPWRERSPTVASTILWGWLSAPAPASTERHRA